MVLGECKLLNRSSSMARHNYSPQQQATISPASSFPCSTTQPDSIVSAAVTKPGGVSIFWADTSGELCSAYYDCGQSSCTASNGSWSGGFVLDNLASSPMPSAAPTTAVSPQSNVVYVFWTRSDGSIWTKNYNSGWSTSAELMSGAMANPGVPVSATSTQSGGISLFWAATDGSIRTAWYANGWSTNSGSGFVIGDTSHAHASKNTVATSLSADTGGRTVGTRYGDDNP